MLFDIRRTLLVTITALAFGASCATAPDTSRIIEEWRAAGPDSAVMASLGTLNPRQTCFIDAFAKDSLPGTPCMTKCIRDGAGYGMGGGCWHACYAYTGVPMPDPARFDHCPAEAAPPPQAPPVLECFSNAPSRSLTILFLDAASGAPLPNAAVVEPVIEYADSTGYLQLDSLPGGRFALAGHSMGFLESSDSVSLGAREACVVLFRLRPASGWGF